MNQIASLLSEYWFFLCMPFVYIAIVIWTYRPMARGRYRADGNIPFDGDTNEDKKEQGSQ